MASYTLQDIDYNLPLTSIAQYPHQARDGARLLVSWPGVAEPTDSLIPGLTEHLPANACIVRNISRVIPARLELFKSTGGRIEVLLVAHISNESTSDALSNGSPSTWKCIVGGRIKGPGVVLASADARLRATVLQRDDSNAVIQFEWDSSYASFGEVIRYYGSTPLPPYIKRMAGETDVHRYQTVYACSEGSVAAPTAGLHFTEELIESLCSRGAKMIDFSLHVGPGTFIPVSDNHVLSHSMHGEQFAASVDSISALCDCISQGLPRVSVGTTSLRVVESLYLAGAALVRGANWCGRPGEVTVDQGAAFDTHLTEVGLQQALTEIVARARREGVQQIKGITRLMLAPGASIRTVDILLTNFHAPRSTLLMLVDGFIGMERRKVVYDKALDLGYQFLSYGDACLLFRKSF